MHSLTTAQKIEGCDAVGVRTGAGFGVEPQVHCELVMDSKRLPDLSINHSKHPGCHLVRSYTE